jgi:hypothetical protein
MSYPYPHRNRAQGQDQIELHKLGTDSGTGVAHTAALTAGVSADVNLPYNAWQVNGVFWANNFDENLTLKIFPYVDHSQTISGPAYFLSQPGSTAAASVITLAATATGSAGAVFHVLGGISGGGATTQQYDNLTPIHGMKVVVTSAGTITTTGTHDWELVCVPEV